jgi:hypothetical protein
MPPRTRRGPRPAARRSLPLRRRTETAKVPLHVLLLFTLTVIVLLLPFAQTNDNRETYGFGPGGEPLPDVKGKPYARLDVLHSWITKDG